VIKASDDLKELIKASGELEELMKASDEMEELDHEAGTPSRAASTAGGS
jgi:hypothetical protein